VNYNILQNDAENVLNYLVETLVEAEKNTFTQLLESLDPVNDAVRRDGRLRTYEV
jgi:predicted nucleic acid-binding OB-fold protein